MQNANKKNGGVFGNETTIRRLNKQPKFHCDPLGSVRHLAVFQQMCQVKCVGGEILYHAGLEAVIKAKHATVLLQNNEIISKKRNTSVSTDFFSPF